MRAVCPDCTSSHTRKKGIRRGKQRWICRNCGRQFSAPIDYTEVGFPKILLFDVETSFYHFVGWGTYKQFIQHHQITKHQYIISQLILDHQSKKEILANKIAIAEHLVVAADILTNYIYLHYKKTAQLSSF